MKPPRSDHPDAATRSAFRTGTDARFDRWRHDRLRPAQPDHKLLEAHPTVSAELLSRLGHGDIAVKPNIDRFSGGRTVRFADGSEEEIDLVVYCTGYKISFPFFDGALRRGTTGCRSTGGSSRSSTPASTSSA